MFLQQLTGLHWHLLGRLGLACWSTQPEKRLLSTARLCSGCKLRGCALSLRTCFSAATSSLAFLQLLGPSSHQAPVVASPVSMAKQQLNGNRKGEKVPGQTAPRPCNISPRIPVLERLDSITEDTKVKSIYNAGMGTFKMSAMESVSVLQL